jgi:hypothetical protein
VGFVVGGGGFARIGGVPVMRGRIEFFGHVKISVTGDNVRAVPTFPANGAEMAASRATGFSPPVPGEVRPYQGIFYEVFNIEQTGTA